MRVARAIDKKRIRRNERFDGELAYNNAAVVVKGY
jgi:hypothetical protein